MPTKLLSMFAATLFVAATAFSAQAFERKPFDSATFAATQNAGKAPTVPAQKYIWSRNLFAG